jgi:low affinity Fe/Cu permease
MHKSQIFKIMKATYFIVERRFERLTSVCTKILGNSITFIVALIMVVFWWSTNLFTSNDIHQNIGDIIFGITFLSLFIIQKSFNRYSALIHLKMNELISSHEPANNSVMHTNKKTEKEIRKLTQEYTDFGEDEEIRKSKKVKKSNRL